MAKPCLVPMVRGGAVGGHPHPTPLEHFGNGVDRNGGTDAMEGTKRWHLSLSVGSPWH